MDEIAKEDLHILYFKNSKIMLMSADYIFAEKTETRPIGAILQMSFGRRSKERAIHR